MTKLDFYVTDVMNFYKNVKKSSSSKIQSGVFEVPSCKSSQEFAKKSKNHVLEMAFLFCLSRVNFTSKTGKKNCCSAKAKAKSKKKIGSSKSKSKKKKNLEAQQKQKQKCVQKFLLGNTD